MSVLNIQEFYELHITPLTPADRLRLLEMMARARIPALSEAAPERPPIGLARFIGAAKGSFPTPAEADAFIRRERDAWDS